MASMAMEMFGELARHPRPMGPDTNRMRCATNG